MIDLYTWPTPNGHKIHIMLEECKLPYRVHPINIGAGDQFQPDFLKISPNNKIPALVDSEGPDGKPISLFESGAILIYLAAKTGQFMPKSDRAKYEVLQWLMFQMGGVGPMLGQAHHFRIYAPEKIDYAHNRYQFEAQRHFGILNDHLATRRYMVGDTYTIVDTNGGGTGYLCIWDAGGTDAIVYNGTRNATLDLRPATLQTAIGGAETAVPR